LDRIIEAVGFGLITAAVLSLASVGLTLQVGVTNFINFAYGDFMTLGAYVAYEANRRGVNFFVSVAIGGVLVAALGVFCNMVLFRPMVRRRVHVLALLVATLGLALLVQNAVVLIWGTLPNRYDVSLGDARHYGPFLLAQGDLALIAISALLLVGLHSLLQYTKFGKSLRATSNNPDLAAACGINTAQVANWTWAISGFLAAIAGAGLVLETNVLLVTSGFSILFLVFAAIILGGIGRPYGAMLGGLVVGMAVELSATFLNPTYSTLSAFVILILALMLRPQGIFATRGKTVA
jgi:branched-subunit amino acid ABC-type transport system permease component